MGAQLWLPIALVYNSSFLSQRGLIVLCSHVNPFDISPKPTNL
jgi:hypothetical protein